MKGIVYELNYKNMILLPFPSTQEALHCQKCIWGGSVLWNYPMGGSSCFSIVHAQVSSCTGINIVHFPIASEKNPLLPLLAFCSNCF
jgi:hypothetical protein